MDQMIRDNVNRNAENQFIQLVAKYFVSKRDYHAEIESLRKEISDLKLDLKELRVWKSESIGHRLSNNVHHPLLFFLFLLIQTIRP